MSLTYIDPTESSHVVDALSDITSDDQAPSIGAKWLAMEISRTFTDYVCVVIADDEVAEDTVRQSLHTALPIHVTRWQGQAYLADIRELRPRMIVVLGKDDVLAQEQAELVATLFARGEPTVVSGTASARLGLGCHLVIHRLGSAAKARVDAIRDVLLLPN
jgi:hypothetical protein